MTRTERTDTVVLYQVSGLTRDNRAYKVGGTKRTYGSGEEETVRLYQCRNYNEFLQKLVNLSRSKGRRNSVSMGE